MKETYLNNLSSELDLVNAKNKDEIIKKYEKRYDFGLEAGMSEEEIEKKLGDPKDIAKEYKEDSSKTNDKKKKKESKTKSDYNLIVHSINDNVRITKSQDNKLHIKFDFDDYDNYNITDNDRGVKVEYLKSKYFALNRKKPGEILIELPEDLTFDIVEITSASGVVYIDYIKSNKLNISTTSGVQNIDKIECKYVNLASVSSTINVDLIVAERVTISSVSGKIYANKLDSSSVIVDTISGDVTIDEATGKLKTTSITGNILINNTEYNSFKGFVKGVFK